MPKCPYCGGEIEHGDGKCIHCGIDLTAAPQPGEDSTPTGRLLAGGRPNDHLVGAILVTIFCCTPLGIVALYKSAQSNGLATAGDFGRAQQAANEAHTWIGWSVLLGLVAIVAGVVAHLYRGV